MYAIGSMHENETNSMYDMNAVELLTTLCADIVDIDDHSIIPVVTHSVNKFKPQKQPSFHSIFVFDPDLREMIRNNLEKTDRIYVRGSLRSHSQVDANGRKSSSGFVVAETIDKLTEFHRKK